MRIARRTFLTAVATTLFSSPLMADDRVEYREYPFTDYFSPRLRGRYPVRQEDIDAANRLAAAMPTGDWFATMQSLSQITEVGSTGELFNMRWKTFANPLIVRFFHDIGYKNTPYPGDCTPWCAATVSWCLRRAGERVPPDPASSQSYLRYGRPVTDPQPGDICVFTDVGDRAHGHVGLFASRLGDTLSVLGGNQLGESETNCGAGYRKSKIGIAQIPINPNRDKRVGIHYLAAYMRPT
jgi:uncharacterized protein (TIGR02594 family)